MFYLTHKNIRFQSRERSIIYYERNTKFSITRHPLTVGPNFGDDIASSNDGAYYAAGTANIDNCDCAAATSSSAPDSSIEDSCGHGEALPSSG